MELILNRPVNQDEIALDLASIHQRSIAITIPDNGIKVDLMRLCEKNYAYRLAQKTDPSLGC